MIAFFARHKTAANLLMVLFVVLGVLGLPSLKRETFPLVPVDKVEITVLYAGATPEDVEDAICGRIEDALSGIENIDEVRSQALESLAKVTVEAVEGTDIQAVFDDVKTEVDAISDFPARAEAPVVRFVGRTNNVAAVAVTGDMSLRDLKAYCEELQDRMVRDPNIEIVEVLGFSDHQIRIEVPAATLMQYGLSASEIADAIRQQSLDLPVGTLETVDGSVIVRFTDERRRPFEFEDLVVIGDENGAEIRLGDIATITDVFELDEDKLTYDGKRAGLLQVEKTRAQDTLIAVEAIKQFIEAERVVAPSGAALYLTQDSSSIVNDRLEMLIKNGWQGLVLVFLVLWLFFSFRLAFWVAMGLPVSFLGAFFFMTAIGYSLNMITMVALLLALGLLMDDAIVLAENVAAHLHAGKTSLEAAIQGVNEVKVGVFSSFLTTVVVFGPLAFLSGDIGAVLKVLPVVLILVICVSLVEAFLILPAHLAHSLHKFDVSRIGKFRRRFDAGIDWARQRVIGRCVDWIVSWRYLAFGVALMLLMISIGMLAGGVLKFQAFPSVDGDLLTARVLLPQGTPLARTEQVVTQLTEAFDRVNEEFKPRQPGEQDLRRAVTIQYNVNADANESGPHVATVTVDLLSAEVRDARLDDVFARWREETGEISDVISVNFSEPSVGPAGSPIEVRVVADDLGDGKAVSLAIQAWLREFRGVFDVFDDLRPGKPELRLRMRDGAAALGFNAQQVSGQLRAAILGDTVSEIQVGPESYEIDLRVAGADRDSLADLDYFYVTDQGGVQVPIGSVATPELARGYSRIARVNGRRTITILGNVDSKLVNVTELFGEMRRTLLPELSERYPSVDVDFEGEVKSGNETGASMLRAFLLGLIGVFLLLSFQFRSYVEPLIVMLAIPMCLIGVVWGHLLMGLDLTLPSLLGFVSLSGVVVNDSILLVEFIKIRRRAGDDIEVAAKMASRLRFRAVLLTSVTTIAGMLPLLAETSLQAQILIPLAASIVFGLMASTLLVLLIIPACYTILGDLRLVGAIAEHAGEQRAAEGA